MAKFKEYYQNQIMLMPPNLADKVPEGHLARFINKVVDQLDIAEIEKGYSELGCHAYHPRLLIKLLIYGYSIGIRSSRRIQKESREDLVFMWLAGMQEPDFRTISDFRKAKIVDIKNLFKQVLGTCRELGMVSCGQISIDGTKLEANSSRNKITFRKSLEKRRDKYDEKLEEILGEAAKIDEEEDLLYRESDGYSDEHNHSIEEIKKALQKNQGAKREDWSVKRTR